MTQSASAEWTVEPVDTSGESGWSLFIDVDTHGDPHAAFYNSGDLRYSKREESGWEQQAILNNADTFALDNIGQRFFINVESPEFYPHFNILLENGLTLQQQLGSHRVSSRMFLDFDQNNHPQIGLVDTNTQQLKQLSWDGTEWGTRIVASGPEFRFGSSSFVATLDDQDQMHFAWQNEADELSYAKPNNDSWSITTPFSQLNSARPYDIDVDSSGDVHLAYDVFTGNVFTGGLFYSRNDGSTWEGGRIPDLLAFGSPRAKLVADESGQPHIFSFDSAFSGPTYLKHIFLEDGEWVNETIDSFTDSSSGPDNIEVVRDGNRYHVLFSTGNKDVFYAFQELGSPGSADMDADGDVDGADFLQIQRDRPEFMATWSQSYGTNLNLTALQSVPEPGSLLLAGLAAGILLYRRA